MKFRYSANVNIPSAGQLLPVFNTTNPLLLVQGNQDLKPELRHTLFSELSIFDQFSFTFLHLRLAGSYTHDKVSWSQTIDQDLVKLNTPVNVPWDYTAYGYAIKAFKVNSIDYLLKPIDKKSLAAALDKYESFYRKDATFDNTLLLKAIEQLRLEDAKKF